MFLTDSRSNSNLTQTPTSQQKLKKLSSLQYKPHSLPQCQFHVHTPQSLICLSPSCSKYLTKFCPQCNHNKNHLQQISHILPVLSKFLQNKWSQISHHNSQVEHEWLICETNIKYCIDILQELHRVIKESKNTRLHQLPIFQNMLDIVLELYQNHAGLQDIVQRIAQLHEKYAIFDKINNSKTNDKSYHNSIDDYDSSQYGKQNRKFINGYCIDEDIKFRLNKWMKSGQQTKKFSQQALAFSQRLSQSIQQKLKQQKHRKNVQHLINKKIASLAQLFKQYKENKNQSSLLEKMQQIPTLTIELPQNHKTATQLNIEQQSSFIIQNLSKFKMLKSLTIKNRNSRIKQNMWHPLISNFQLLKNLKQLTLNIRNQDLLFLTPLLKSSPKSIRQISILHITITDQHNKLDMKNVALFCNCFQLRQLYLQLSRNSINKGKFIQFMQEFRFKTTLSCLPLDKLEIVLTKNLIKEIEDIRECEKKFQDKYKEIKKSSVIF